MSRMERHNGKLRILAKWENIEEHCKEICLNRGVNELDEWHDNWKEQFMDAGFDDLVLVGERIYKIIEDNETDGDIFQANVNDDGSISYFVSYYNGGCGFSEAIETAIEGMGNK